MADARHEPTGAHADPRPPLGSALLEFAEPLVAQWRESEEALHEGLLIAAWVWNTEVTDAGRPERDVAAWSRAQLAIVPEPTRTRLRTALEVLAERKRTLFADDKRLVREILVERDPSSGELVVRAKEHRSAAEVAPRSHPRKTKRYVTDMRHSLGANGLWATVPRSARPLANYLGAVAAAGSRLSSGATTRSDIVCRKRTGRGACRGVALVQRDANDDRIVWCCAGCGDEGWIDGWRDTAWDQGGRERRIAALAPAEKRRIELSDAEFKALQASRGLHERALGALLGMQRVGKRWFVEASCGEVEDLAVAAATEVFESQSGDHTPRYRRIERLLHEALRVNMAAERTAAIADILSLRAVTERAMLRSVPRLEPCGAHQLSVVLDEVEPCVRRELLVRSDTTLEELHGLLQVAFGWSESHLHLFQIAGRNFMRPDQAEDIEHQPSHAARLSDVAPQAGAELVYEYDFGDSWEHRVSVVNVLPPGHAEEAPRCLYGEGAAPPEDCGGPGGYQDLLAALGDPQHPEHREMLGWVGGPFDPFAFDLAETNRVLRQLARWMA